MVGEGGGEPGGLNRKGILLPSQGPIAKCSEQGLTARSLSLRRVHREGAYAQEYLWLQQQRRTVSGCSGYVLYISDNIIFH